MRSSDLLDFERLQQPLSAENPAGENLRGHPLRDALAQTRKPRRAVIESDSDEETDWPAVIDQARQLLLDNSRDLEVACWLTEALLHVHGACGLRDGLRSVALLMEQYWDDMYPRVMDEDDLEVRAARLTILTDANAGPRIPYTVRRRVSVAEPDEYGIITLEDADPLGLAPRREGEEDDVWEQRRTMALQQAERARTAVARSSTEFYLGLNEDLAQCQALIDQIDAIATEKLGHEAPSRSRLREAVSEVQTFVRRILADRHVGESEEVPADVSYNGSPGGGGSSRGSGPIQSRADAIQRLKECADYLRRNGPHSMVASLVDRAVHWAEMPLSRVLQDLIRDGAALDSIRETLGIPSQTDNEEG